MVFWRRHRRTKIFAIIVLFAFLIIIGIQPFLMHSQTQTTLPHQALALHTSGTSILDINNSLVNLRGIGRTGDLESTTGMWSGPGMNVAESGQQFQPLSSNIPLMDATFRCYQQYWHVNMIRVFIPVNWYWNDNFSYGWNQ